MHACMEFQRAWAFDKQGMGMIMFEKVDHSDLVMSKKAWSG